MLEAYDAQYARLDAELLRYKYGEVEFIVFSSRDRFYEYANNRFVSKLTGSSMLEVLVLSAIFHMLILLRQIVGICGIGKLYLVEYKICWQYTMQVENPLMVDPDNAVPLMKENVSGGSIKG
ncbi:hypothetical protein M8C21_031102 [Ambrosia artemisiifolia]|uniref:Uncharacterized protein n=1 Tax=Ambrosia artemisiifolia TaxID=4212 RepID=A0AAD5GBG4_AMBAR|nr:hypothetical protein M8C21_031102 [Ambrosia artemisiifolia]